MTRAIALLLLTAPFACAQGVIKGTVINSITRGPVGGAAVRLSSAGKQIASTYATSTGDFRFSDLAPAEYDVLVKADGYFASDAYSNSPSYAITSAGETRAADVELAPATRFRGRVLDGDGRPMPGVRVEVITRIGRQGSQSMVTDKDGAYHTLDLLPGAYFLLARPDRNIPNKPAPSKDQKISWAATFYPNIADVAAAAPIIAHGGDMPGYDIRLRSTPVFRIRGIALDESGRPVAGASLALSGAKLWHVMMSPPDAEAVSGADGSFEFTDIGPGDWRIDGITEPRTALLGFTILAVTRHDEEQVRIRLAASFEVNGVVKLTGDGAESKSFPLTQPGKSHDFRIIPIAAPVGANTIGSISPNGSFRITRVYAGRYRLNPLSPAGFYLSQVLQGEQDVTNQEFDLAAGGPPLTFVFRSDTGSVRGRVDDGAGALVLVIPRGAAYNPSFEPEIARCDKDGKFNLSSLAPGDYSLVAFRRLIERDLLVEPSFIQQISRAAPTVHIDPAGSASLDLRITAWPN